MAANTLDRRIVTAVYAMILLNHPNAPKNDLARKIEAALDPEDVAVADDAATQILDRINGRVRDEAARPKRRQGGLDWSNCHDVTVTAAEIWVHEILVDGLDMTAEPSPPVP